MQGAQGSNGVAAVLEMKEGDCTMTECTNLERFTRVPFRVPKGIREGFSRYCGHYSTDRDHVIFDDRVSHVLEAQGFHIEEHPRSKYSVDQLYNSLAKYAPGLVSNPEMDQHLSEGIKLARACFARPNRKMKLSALPFDVNTVFQITSKPQASAGLTAFGETKESSFMRGLERGLQTLNGEKGPEPCIAYSRTQFNDKTRLVWGFPYSMTIIEGLVAWPLLQEFKRGGTPMAFAKKTGVLGCELTVASYHYKWAYSLDVSGFDSSISASLIHEAFDILRTWFDLEQVEPTTGKTVRDVFKLIERYFISCPIVMPDGCIYKGRRHGVPSGSYFTQIIDSIVNVIFAGTISSRFSMHIDKSAIQVLGDDLLIWSNRNIDVKAIAGYATKRFGIKFNSDKSEKTRFDEPIKYLGRVWKNGIPDLNEEEILARMVYPERFRKYAEDVTEARRQVRLLIFSMATQYWSAWKIAHKLYGSNAYYAQGGSQFDVQTYTTPTGPNLVMDRDQLTGLQYFLENYVWERDLRQMPHTAILFWL